MVNEWTRADLPAVMDLVKASVDAVATDPSGGAYAALDAVVEHLNAHHPKPEPDRFERQSATIGELQGCFLRVEADAARWRRAHEIVEGERDTARESLRRLRDETDFDLFTVRDQLKQCRGEREQMTRERDEARADRDHYRDSLGATVTERDEWRARAEAAEARTAPAVTKADIEKALRKAFTEDLGLARTTDAVRSLVSGADPAVFVVRESDIAAVEVAHDERGWHARGATWSHEPTADGVRDGAMRHLRDVAQYEALARAIEAEQATDPVEELAERIESATREAIRQVCDDLADVAPSLDPLTVEQAMEVTAASRKVAEHVLGQGADDE